MAEGTTLGKAWVQIVPSAKGISGSIARLLNGEATSAGTSAGNLLGGSLVSTIKGVIAAAGIGAAVNSALTAGMNFDEQMAHVAAISGATGDDFDALRKKALELGASTKFSATEAAKAFDYMAMAGWNVGQMMDGVDGILSLAAADGADLGTTSDIVTDALTGFNLKAADAGHFADILAVASSSANTNVTMMGETFKYVAGVVGSLYHESPERARKGMEDTALAVGLMANAGLKASQAGTSLRSILTRIATNAGKTSSQMGALDILTEKLNVQFYNADGTVRAFSDVLRECRAAWGGLSAEEQTFYAKTIGGLEAMTGWLNMMNASEESVNALSAAIANADGKADEMALITQNSLKGAVTSFKSAVEGLQIAVYDKFSGTLTDIVNLARDFVSNITTGVITGDWSPLMEFVGGLAAKLYQNFRAALEQAGLLEGFDALIQTVSTIFTGVSETVARVFPEVAATVENALERIRTATAPAVEFISALLSGFATYVHSGQAAADVTNILSTAVEFLGGVIGTAAEIVAVIVEKTADFITWLSEGSTGADLFAAAVAGIVGAFAAFQIALGVHALIGTFAKAIEGAKLAFAAFNAVMAANPLLLVATLIGGVAAALLTLWHTNEGFRDAVIKIYEIATNFVTRKVDNVIELFTVTIPNALTWLREFVSQVAAEILAFFTGLWDGIITTFSNIGQWFGERFTEAYNAVTGAWNAVGKWFGDRWTDISNAFTGAQKWFSDTFTAAWKGVTDVFDDVKTFFEGVWSNITGVFTGAIEWFRNLGQNIVKGLKEGIGGLWDGFLSLLGLKTEEVKETFTGADGFDTHSPSKVFARIGRDVVFGLRDGVNKSSGQAVSAMESTISGIVAAGQSVNSSALFPSAVEAVERTRNLLRVSPETHFPGFAPQILRDNPAQTFRPAPVNITMVNEVGGERYERRQYQYRDAETARRGPSFVKT